jgi:hypothetical protein
VVSLELPPEVPTGPTTAADYVSELRSMYGRTPSQASLPVSSEPRPSNFTAEPWMRIPITPDVELNVRRRGSRIDTRLAKAVEELKRILSQEEEQS